MFKTVIVKTVGTDVEEGIFFTTTVHYRDRINHEKLAEDIKIQCEALNAEDYDVISIVPVTVSEKERKAVQDRYEYLVFSYTESVIITAKKRT